MNEKIPAELRINSLLKGSGHTMCAAESCTGGRISNLITSVPGASEYYLGSVTSYSVKIKESLLSVDPEIVDSFGIVSCQVASAMADGVRKLMKADFSVATTGWADSYGDEHEPAGTVWIAVSCSDGSIESMRYNSQKGRVGNIEAFSKVATSFLADFIEKHLNN